MAYQPYSGTGNLTLSPNGFTITGWGLQNGAVVPFNTSGTYIEGYNCALQLNFSSSNSSSSGSTAFAVPTAVSGIMVNTTTGVISLTTSNNTVITGQFYAQ